MAPFDPNDFTAQAQHQPEDVMATALGILAKATRDAHQDGRMEATNGMRTSWATGTDTARPQTKPTPQTHQIPLHSKGDTGMHYFYNDDDFEDDDGIVYCDECGAGNEYDCEC